MQKKYKQKKTNKQRDRAIPKIQGKEDRQKETKPNGQHDRD